ncbi:MAG: DUF3368 domain-containing protein [Pirellulales bacterium]|nr:DUF3368 domain-containing protein [Pirellulales bacterium]
MTPPVVSNASPLIALEQIGQLPILKGLFGTVAIPPAVAREIAPTVSPPEWIQQQQLTQPIGPLILGTSLGAGESEAIALGLEIQSRFVVLDDRAARRLAQALGLSVIGTLGVLLAAKRRNLLPAVRPCLDGLLNHDFRIAPSLHAQVLHDAGEDA